MSGLILLLVIVLVLLVFVRNGRKRKRPLARQNNPTLEPIEYEAPRPIAPDYFEPQRSPIPIREPLYRTRSSVMNRSEKAFFYELEKQLPSGYHIFPNMRIADFIDAVDGIGFYNRRNKILPKHIDFLVCDANFRPVVAIEVNGSSHRRPDRAERDEQIRQIFADAELPLEFVDVGSNFEISVSKIKDTLLPLQGGI